VLAVATLLVMILCFMPVPLWESATSHWRVISRGYDARARTAFSV